MLTPTTTITTLPRLLFFRWTRPGQPQFLLDQLGEQLACLRLFFDVHVVDYDGDYDELCDRFRPDLVLFESGVYAGSRRLTNTDSHPDVPKLGFLNADAFDPVRAVFVADMAEWGVETFFTVSTVMADYTPEIADRLYVWPNFVDPSVHRDHGLPKVIPVALPGSRLRHYPWRNRVSRVLAQNYPVLSMPHFGWAQSDGERRMATGESFSRLLNSAWFAPSCGSFTRDLVRKHLEIPAARTCLVAEPTPALEAAGFVDMVNCVLADTDDVLDKLDHLFGDLDELEAITEAGHQLVHRRHTAEHRRQIRDWYDLVVTTGSTQGVEQEHPLAPLRAATAPTASRARVVLADDRVLLRAGWSALGHGRHAAALRSFGAASNLQYLPEAEVGRAYTQLLQGHSAAAAATVARLLDHNDHLYGPRSPDPVVWAMHVRALLGQGNLAAARAAVDEFPGLHHVELDRARTAVARLTGERVQPVLDAAPRPSIAPLPATEWTAWVRALREMLAAAGQPRLAAALGSLADQPDPGATPVCLPFLPRETGDWQPKVLSLGRRWIDDEITRGKEWVRSQGRQRVTAQWLEAVADIAEREVVGIAVIVEPSRLSLRERSVRLALSRNQGLPMVTCTDSGGLAAVPDDKLAGLVYVGARTACTSALAQRLRSTQVVILDGTERSGHVRLLDELTATGEFELVSHHWERGGHGILRRRSGSVRTGGADTHDRAPALECAGAPGTEGTNMILREPLATGVREGSRMFVPAVAP